MCLLMGIYMFLYVNVCVFVRMFVLWLCVHLHTSMHVHILMSFIYLHLNTNRSICQHIHVFCVYSIRFKKNIAEKRCFSLYISISPNNLSSLIKLCSYLHKWKFWREEIQQIFQLKSFWSAFWTLFYLWSSYCIFRCTPLLP